MENRILGLIYRAFLRATREKYGEKTDEKIIHVHELVSCRYKSEFARELPELFTPIRPVIMIGESVDEYLKKLFEKDPELSELTETTEGEYSKDFVFDGEKVTLIGRPDIVLRDMVVEVKYSQFENDLPREHHVAQVKLYLILTGKSLGKLVYVTNRQLREFDVENDWGLEDLEKFYMSWSSPRYEWECSYCSIRPICPYYESKRSEEKEPTEEEGEE